MNVVVKKPTSQELESLGVKSWPIWEKEESTFDWHYDEKEVCYLLQGDVTVSLPNGTQVNFGKGDLVTFPQGLSCSWHIKKAVKKHYHFG